MNYTFRLFTQITIILIYPNCNLIFKLTYFINKNNLFLICFQVNVKNLINLFMFDMITFITNNTFTVFNLIYL